jgi:hypothetical protein
MGCTRAERRHTALAGRVAVVVGSRVARQRRPQRHDCQPRAGPRHDPVLMALPGQDPVRYTERMDVITFADDALTLLANEPLPQLTGWREERSKVDDLVAVSARNELRAKLRVALGPEDRQA